MNPTPTNKLSNSNLKEPSVVRAPRVPINRLCFKHCLRTGSQLFPMKVRLRDTSRSIKPVSQTGFDRHDPLKTGNGISPQRPIKVSSGLLACLEFPFAYQCVSFAANLHFSGLCSILRASDNFQFYFEFYP